jgi:hypothetical protein
VRACHVEADQGDFKVTLATFARKVDQAAIDRILSDDPDKYMPPDSANGEPASQRVLAIRSSARRSSGCGSRQEPRRLVLSPRDKVTRE